MVSVQDIILLFCVWWESRELGGRGEFTPLVQEKLNAFFSNIVKELNIKAKEDLLCDVSDINDPVERAIQKYKNHPSIQMIKETFDSSKTFSFDLVSSDTFFKEIVSLDTKKATHSNDVPTKIVKANADLFSIFASDAFNESVVSVCFKIG